MNTFNANPATRRAWPWHCRVGAAVLSLGLLLSCGGGGGPGSELVSPSPTVLQGAYQASSGGNDFVSFVTPDNKLYALYFLATDPMQPAIFSGPITLGQDGAAEIPSLTMFTTSTPQLSSGSGTFSIASSQSYRFAGPSTVNGQPLPTFDASALPTSADLSGTWTGTWADSNNILTSSVITFGTAAEQPTAWDFFSSCQAGSTLALRLETYTQLGGTEKFFQARLTIPQITGCVRTATASVELSGVGFIHASPVVGKQWRLDLVLVDRLGSGISFRGDQ